MSLSVGSIVTNVDYPGVYWRILSFKEIEEYCWARVEGIHVEDIPRADGEREGLNSLFGTWYFPLEDLSAVDNPLMLMALESL